MTTTYLELIHRNYPERTALVFGEQTMTFAEVDDLSGQLANTLQALGAGSACEGRAAAERGSPQRAARLRLC